MRRRPMIRFFRRHRLTCVLFLILIYLIGGAVAPFFSYQKIKEDTVKQTASRTFRMNGAGPESTWGDYTVPIAPGSRPETADIFPIAMENNYKVGKVLIDAILAGTF